MNAYVSIKIFNKINNVITKQNNIIVTITKILSETKTTQFQKNIMEYYFFFSDPQVSLKYKEQLEPDC